MFISIKTPMESASSSCHEKNKIVKGSCLEIEMTEEYYGIQRLKMVVGDCIGLIKRLYLLIWSSLFYTQL